MLEETTLLSQVQALTEPPPHLPWGSLLPHRECFLNERKNNPANPALQRKKKTPFFVPKTVDMLVQHPQDQAINLFFLLTNPNEKLWASRMA